MNRQKPEENKVMSLNILATELIEITPEFLVLIRQKVKKHSASNLTMPQLRILSRLKKGPLRNSELADRCGLDVTSMSRMVDHLVKCGFILRSTNPQDKRCVKLQLSAKGRREQEDVVATIRTWITANMAHLSASEQAQLSVGLKMLRKLEELMLQDIS